jgi:N-methylhydantoinase A
MARLGIDIGGTFTDFIYLDGEGATHLYKVSSRPDDPAVAIAEGLELIAQDRSLQLSDFLDSCELVIHGTTVGINALIQHKGAKTALLCTEGFRDSFEIRLGYKEERYDFSYPPPPVLVPRYLRLPVRERVNKHGEIVRELDEQQLREHVRTLRRERVEAIAVCFLWSFLRPEHEQRASEIIAEEFPDAYVSLSVDVLPQIREYERTSTTIVNSYIGPILKTYVQQIEDMFIGKGFQNQIRYMQANGGFASGEWLVQKPVYAINSGPAAGPTAAIFFAQQLGFDNLISVDMGGTSFDICLVESGLPDTVKNVDVVRYRVGIPMININTIGAGGGSIAWIDLGGMLHVGPQSAEAIPGPACYQRGGTEPTVTDANLVLGYLNPKAQLAGGLQLDVEAAQQAVDEKIAQPLGLSIEQAAHGIFEIVNHNMTAGISEISIERGYDPRDFAMVVGGGAGAIHAGRLAAELGVPAVIIPKVASALCAFGEVVADLRHDYAASYATRVREADLSKLDGLYEEMERQGREELAREGVPDDAVVITRWMDMRYLGQVHECTISLPNEQVNEESIPQIEALFHEKHEALYTYAERENGVCELINLALTARGKVPAVSLPELEQRGEEAPTPTGTRSVYFVGSGRKVDTAVYDGTSLGADDRIVGPAIVEEPTTTIVVFPGWSVRLDKRGFYLMTRVDT